MQDRWREPGFVERSHAWIDERLADLGRTRTGEVEQPHVTDWSTVMRVPTDGGTVWFKANDDTMVHEAAVLELVATRSLATLPGAYADLVAALPEGVHQVLDWGDACISHPFFTLAVTLEGVISWGLDDVEDSEDLGPHLTAYLTPYATHYGTTAAHLREAAAIAMRLGWVCRAVNGALPQEPDRTHVRLKMFLDGKP